MRTIRVRRETGASPDVLFALLADPATYRHFPGVTVAELVRPGKGSPFDVGAVRRIGVGPFRFEEEITRSEPGVRLDYRIVSSRPPLDHEGGTLLFTRTPSGCVVDWSSTYSVPVPVIGPLLAILGGWRMRRAFDDAIRLAAELAQTR